MAVIKEFHCIDHGYFTGSHPICCAFGCDSSGVMRVFLTAPGFKSDGTKRFDSGLRKSADMMGIGNFKSARAGETSFAGRAAQENKDLGTELLWGNEVQKVMGKSFTDLTGMAAQPFTIERKDEQGNVTFRDTLTRNNGLSEAATEVGLTARRIPKAGEISVARADADSTARVQSVAA